MNFQEKREVFKTEEETQRKRQATKNKYRNRILAKKATERRGGIDKTHKINQSFKAQICRSLKTGKDLSWETDSDFTLEQLIAHIEELWESGMSWENRGIRIAQWNIAHHRTGSHYNYTSRKSKGFKEYWSLENLYPAWRTHTTKKCSKTD